MTSNVQAPALLSHSLLSNSNNIVSIANSNRSNQCSISTSSHDQNIINDKRTQTTKIFDHSFACVIEELVTVGNEFQNMEYLQTHLELTENYINAYNEQTFNSKTHKMKEMEVQSKIWKLLQFLRKAKQTSIEENTNLSYFEKYFNPALNVSHSMANDPQMRKMDHILQWLQELTPHVQYLRNGEISFKRTMSFAPNTARNPLLTSLDPDIITRNNISIADDLKVEEIQDFREEEHLLMIVFQLIRKGSFTEAV